MEKEALLQMLENASRDRPVTRRQIRAAFRVSDRRARRMVEELRDAGYPVVGTSDYKGYWVAGSEEELKWFMRNYIAKARTIQRRALRMCGRFYEQYQERQVQ